MLRRMDGVGALGLHRMDWDGAAALGRKALEWTALAGATYLLCRLQAGRGLAPFALAFVAAALLAGRNAAALLAGCLAGAVNGGLRDFNLRLPVGAAIVLGGSVAWEALQPALRRAEADGRLERALRRLNGLRPGGARAPAPRMQARSPNGRASAVCSVLAGTGVLLPGLWGMGDPLWPDAAAVAAASVAAVAAAPFLRAGLAAGFRRRWLNPEERAGLWLLLGLPVAGLARLSPPLGLCVGGALAQLLYPAGALAGAGIGGALLAADGAAAALALAVAAGSAAQLCAALSAPARAASAGVAALSAGVLLGAPPGLLVGVGASSLLAAAAPRAWAEALARLARPAPEACDPQRLALRVQRASAARLRALGAAFGELAEGYRAPVALPDEQALLKRLRDRLCDGCGGYGTCWTGGGDGGARLLCDLIARAVALSGEAPLFEGEAPPELARRCRRGWAIPERLGELLEDFARRRRTELKRGAENRLISAQFAQAKRLLDGLADRQARPLKLRLRQGERAAAALERAGIGVSSVTALGGGGVELAVELDGAAWTPRLAALASASLGRAFGRRYAAAGLSGREARFVRRPRLRAETGVLCASREAGSPCGDSHLTCMLDDERLLVLLCDGMGSGDDAARESAVAVRLLGRFLRAGAPSALAIETVNALLLNRGGEDMFATVDMLVLDLSTGAARFSKLAACPTLIARAGTVRRVAGGRLPLGILEKVEPGVHEARLVPGDVLLMASDGVMDAAGDDALAALLSAGGDPRDLARRALAAAEAACPPGHRDDMTAICLRVGEH